MIYALIGILLGIIIALNINVSIPLEYIKYTAVIIVALLDSLFGAIKAELTREEFNVTLFITGLIFNILLAFGITYLGEHLGLDLYLAVAVVFTFRIFTNLGKIRRALIKKFTKN
ncbi:small basic family protein [Candidatus Peregrinibacteria bacterium]|nr:small basic family protein [Candidatus Peregrinibacteria bacterium]